MLLIKNANILTLNPAQPKAEAVLIDNSRINAVGSSQEMSSLAADSSEIIDLSGKTLLPGFVDSHMHPVMYAFFLMNLDLNSMTSMAELLDRIKTKAGETEPGQWILGLRFNEEGLKEQRLPTIEELDSVAPDNPLMIMRYCGHLALANSKAMALAGISKDSEDPHGGEIERDTNGELTGALRETAISLVVEQLPPPDWNDFSEAIGKGFDQLAAYGLTGIHGIIQTGEMGPSGKLGYLSVTAMKAMRESIPLRMYLMIVATEIEQMRELLASELHDPAPDAMCKIGAWKMICDGSLGGHSALMFEPYSDAPEMTGIPVWSDEELEKMVHEAHSNGIQLSMHCIGDKMVKIILDTLERAMADSPLRDHRHRLEHASILASEMIQRAKKLGVVMSVQPPFIYSEKDWVHKRLGDRVKHLYPFRSFLENGFTVCAGSDAPVEIPDPILGIYSAVNRLGVAPEEAVSVEDAIRMYTTHAAHASFQENIKGTIEPGKLADLVALSEDPLAIPPAQLRDIAIEMTMVGGQVIFSRK